MLSTEIPGKFTDYHNDTFDYTKTYKDIHFVEVNGKLFMNRVEIKKAMRDKSYKNYYENCIRENEKITFTGNGRSVFITIDCVKRIANEKATSYARNFIAWVDSVVNKWQFVTNSEEETVDSITEEDTVTSVVEEETVTESPVIEEKTVTEEENIINPEVVDSVVEEETDGDISVSIVSTASTETNYHDAENRFSFSTNEFHVDTVNKHIWLNRYAVARNLQGISSMYKWTNAMSDNCKDVSNVHNIMFNEDGVRKAVSLSRKTNISKPFITWFDYDFIQKVKTDFNIDYDFGVRNTLIDITPKPKSNVIPVGKVIKLDKDSSIFKFGLDNINILYYNNDYWFNRMDVSNTLNYMNPSSWNCWLDEDEKMFYKSETDTHKSVCYLSETGLYKVLCRCNRPKANDFFRLVTREILPALRKTGENLKNFVINELNCTSESLIKRANLVDVTNKAECYKFLYELEVAKAAVENSDN